MVDSKGLTTPQGAYGPMGPSSPLSCILGGGQTLAGVKGLPAAEKPLVF